MRSIRTLIQVNQGFCINFYSFFFLTENVLKHKNSILKQAEAKYGCCWQPLENFNGFVFIHLASHSQEAQSGVSTRRQ